MKKVRKVLSSIMSSALALSLACFPIAAFASEEGGLPAKGQGTAQSILPQEELSISLEGPISAGSEEVTLNIAGDMTNRNVMVRTFDASATSFRPSYVPFEDDTVIYNKTSAPSGHSIVQLNKKVEEGQQIVAFIYDYDDDVNVRSLAASSPVTVTAGQTDPVDPTQFTRQDLVNGSYVTLSSPNTEGAAAGKFLTTDRTATGAVTLHQAVESATLSVVAWPKSLSFGSGYVDSDYINQHGIRLFTKHSVKTGDVVDITFDDEKFASISDPTAYVIIAYLQFADTTNDDSWPIVKPTSNFEIVDENGGSYEEYVFPDATIVEDELPVGATVLHMNLTGDERLFKLARDTRGSSSALQIHVALVEYDASVTPSTYDFEETPQVRLYSADVFESMTNAEISLSEPLKEGKRVRALVYTTQYQGSLAPNPIPASHDYSADKPDDSVLVTTSAPPVVLNPATNIDTPLTVDTRSFDVSVANPPENGIVLVKRYSTTDEIATQNGKFVSSFEATAGNHTIDLSEPLNSGERVVAFILVSGEVKAQSKVAVVAGEQTQADVMIMGPVDKDDSTVKVQVNCEIPSDAHISLRQFDEPQNTEWGSMNSIGSVDNPVQGENVVDISGLRRDYIVAFLATDYGSTIYARSEPMKVGHEAVAPQAMLSPADVMFTEGDLFVTLKWSADEYARDISYKIYQYEGETLDVNTAEVLAQGTIPSSSHSGTFDVSVGSKLRANCKVQAILTADDLAANSNDLTVSPRPNWAQTAPTVSFGQKAIRVGDSTIAVNSNYDPGYEELGSEYFCVVAVYEITPELVEMGYTDEDLEGTPVVARYHNDTRDDDTCGALTMTFSEGISLTEGNYLVAKLRLPDPVRQDKQSMWRDYVSEAIPIVGKDAEIPGTEDPNDPDQPENPDTPDQPENPDTPDQPDQPDKPDQPENPGTPGQPDQPGKPDQPVNPGTPGHPDQPGNPGSVTPDVEIQTMFRLYNPNSGEHFYTASPVERAATIAAGWLDEGYAWTAPVKSNTPVYRLYSGTDHHYTTSEVERDYLMSIGWSDEGIGWYSDDAKGVGLHRLFNPNVDLSAPTNNSGSHHYTTSDVERDNLVSLGWSYENVGWYGTAS